MGENLCHKYFSQRINIQNIQIVEETNDQKNKCDREPNIEFSPKKKIANFSKKETPKSLGFHQN